jgi:hypothetical protein
MAKAFGVAILVAAGMVAVSLYLAVTPVIPVRLLEQIEPGMPMAEVRRILGSPHEGEDSSTWIYRRFGNPGWVEVDFDNNGTVRYINDESAFP